MLSEVPSGNQAAASTVQIGTLDYGVFRIHGDHQGLMCVCLCGWTRPGKPVLGRYAVPRKGKQQ